MIAKSSVFLILLVTCTLCALGYQPPSKTPPPSFLPSSPLKSGNFPSLSFLANLPLYISFSWTPLKVGSFSETQKYFSLLIPSYLLKVTKFLDKISQFEFLAMREKNIFACKLFLSLNISDFNLFMWKFHPPPPPYPVKSHLPPSRQPLSKSWGLVKPLSFGKFGWRLNPPPAERGVHTMMYEIFNSIKIFWREHKLKRLKDYQRLETNHGG